MERMKSKMNNCAPLISLAKFVSGGTPSKRNPEYWNGDIPWISAKTMKVDRVSTSDLFISEEGLCAGSKLAPIGSILILTRGSELFNRIPICYVEKEVAFNQDVKCIIPNESVIGEFLYYALLSKKTELLNKIGVTGIGAGKLVTDDLKNLQIPICSKGKQLQLIKFIRQFDIKISCNTAEIETMNTLLFSIYTELFKEPEDITKTTIPGWRLSNVFHEVVENCNKNKDEKPLPVLSVVKEGEFKASEDVFTKQVYSKSTKNYKIVRRNQIAYNPARANIGSIAMLKEFDIGLVSPVYTVFEVKEDITPTYFYYYMKQPMFLEMIKHHAIGTTRQNFPFEAFKMFPIVVPPMELQLKFEEIAKPIEQKISKLKEENEVLAEIRDTLLPKLMSGEIPVEVGEENA